VAAKVGIETNDTRSSGAHNDDPVEPSGSNQGSKGGKLASRITINSGEFA
jgi:hypothetical protein